ncbi:hypothetical protein BG57_30535 [Caballeronia grimmiae]|uniref:Uncharacterized protein n=1 Tax=Caballeronia grimmiae TaxID=1071679 RepID=A0A069NK50_9BURK|nr:hypothetical protein BG57_30535 [Caballeronia grimmiae]
MAAGIERGLDLAAHPVVRAGKVSERRRRQQDDEVRASLNLCARDAFISDIGDIEKVEDDVVSVPLQMLEHRNGPRPVAAVIADEQRPHGTLH